MFKIRTAGLLVFSFFILAGCQQLFQPLQDATEAVSGKVKLEQKKLAERNIAKIKCQELCQDGFAADAEDFDKGPCLSNEVIPDWVCDVAHSPRQAVDNDPANQCSAFRDGTAHHFVELDGNCNLIQIY